VLLIVTECYRCLAQQGFPSISRHSVALGRVWWWAQNWAQAIRVPRSVADQISPPGRTRRIVRFGIGRLAGAPLVPSFFAKKFCNQSCSFVPFVPVCGSRTFRSPPAPKPVALLSILEPGCLHTTPSRLAQKAAFRSPRRDQSPVNGFSLDVVRIGVIAVRG
jgi:hypothetical protein